MTIGRWVGVTWSGVIGQALTMTPCTSAMSAPTKTATTPWAAWPRSVSMAVILAWANGLRTMARCSMPGSWMLSVQRVRPVISRWSSLRLRAGPISAVGRSSTAVIRPPPGWRPTRPRRRRRPAIVLAQADTALTMLW